MSSTSKSGAPKALKAVARFGLGVGLLATLVWLLGPDWAEVSRRLEVQPGAAALALLGTTAAAMFGAARWRLLNEHLTETRLPFATYFHYVALTRLIGQFSSMLLMELVGRGVGLKSAGSDDGLGRLVTPVLLERVVDVLFPIAMLGWAITVHQGGGPGDGWMVSAAATLLVTAVLIVPMVRPAARAILWGYGRVLRWRGRAFDAPEIVVPPRIAVSVTALGLGRYLAVLLQFYGIGAAVGAVRDPGVVASAFPVSQLSAILAITPGGLGVQDAGWAGALSWQGVDETSIAMFVLAIHAGIIVNFAIITLLSLPLASRRSRMQPESSS